MSKINQFTLNTFYTSSKTSPNFYLPNPVFGVSHFRINEVMIANEFYTIDLRNNKISFKEDSGTTTNITIPSANYTASSLCSALKTLFEANSENTRIYTLTYSSATAKITISINTGTITFLTIANNSYYELGLLNSLNSASASITTDVIDLSGVKLINLVSSSFGKNVCNVVGSNYSVIASIPINNSFLSILYYNNNGELIDIDLDNLYQISFKLLDERFREITPTKDYQISLILRTI